MKKNKLKITILLACLISMGGAIDGYAHGGRTDGNGGHKDNKNASGLGSYHYHHGYSAHLHTNGCPYENKTNQTNKPANSSTLKSPTQSSGKSEAQKKAEEQKRLEDQKKAEEQKKLAEEQRIAKEKETLTTKAKEQGFNDGYSQKENSSASYEGNYKTEYVDAYTNGFNDGKFKVDTEIKDANSAGYSLGKSGSQKTDKYEKDFLKTAYNSGYDKGYEDYLSSGIEEYKSKGLQDATDNKDESKFDDSVNAKFKEAYITAYTQKKDDIAKEKKATEESTALGGAVLVGGAIAGGIIYKKKKGKKQDKFNK